VRIGYLGAMKRTALVLGLFVLPLLAAPALSATKPAFKVTTTGGKTASYSYLGYQFKTGITPKLGVAGSVEIDANASSSAKSVLKIGTLKSASLHVVASLPKKINKTYVFVSPKITSVEFDNGQAGPIAEVKLSYKKLTD
jgi:hypothetical protein